MKGLALCLRSQGTRYTFSVPLPTYDKCFICQNHHKLKKDRRKSEKLLDCKTFESGNCLLTVVDVRRDEHVIIALKGACC